MNKVVSAVIDSLLSTSTQADARASLGLGSLSTQSGIFSGTHSGTSSGTNTGDQTNIAGNAGTVSSIGNLTGVITSSNRATSIANNALSIAKTNGLQAALDGKQIIAVSRATYEGRPIYPAEIYIDDFPMIGGGSAILTFSGIQYDRPVYSSGSYDVYWDGSGNWVIYDHSYPEISWYSGEDVPVPQQVTSWSPGPASTGAPVVTASANITPAAISIGELIRYGDSAPFDWYISIGVGIDTSWELIVNPDSVNKAIQVDPYSSLSSLGAGGIGQGLITAGSEFDARTILGSGSTGDQLFTSIAQSDARSILESGTIGDQLFIAETLDETRSVLGVISRVTTSNIFASSTTPVAIPELAFPVEANKTYKIDIGFVIQSSATPGYQVTMTYPTNSRTGEGHALSIHGANVKGMNLGATSVAINRDTAGNPNGTIGVTGHIYLRPTSSGNVTFTTSHQSAGGGSTGLVSGSGIFATKL